MPEEAVRDLYEFSISFYLCYGHTSRGQNNLHVTNMHKINITFTVLQQLLFFLHINSQYSIIHLF